jgi:hypothetical protein
MSKLDHKIALQSAMLTGQRLRLQQQKQSLHLGIMAFCKRPATLGCAALAGFVLARIYPTAFTGRLQTPVNGSGPSAAGTGSLAGTLRIVLISVAPTLIKRAITAGFASRDRALRQQS